MLLRSSAIACAFAALAACSGAPEPAADDLEVQSDARKDRARPTGADEEQGGAGLAGQDEESPDRTPPAAAGAAPGTGAGTPAAPAAPPPEAKVRLDGAEVNVTQIRLWAPNAEGVARVFIDVEGPGAPAGTDLSLSFTKVGKGCVASPDPKPQELYLRPPRTADQFRSSAGAACGLEITSFPTNAGDDATGTFVGTVSGINGAQGKTRRVDVEFKARRTK